MFQIEIINGLVSRCRCEVRIKVREEKSPSSWSKWISEPSANYIETSSSGPWPNRDIDWVDINPIALEHIGRLVKDKKVDNTEFIKQMLVSSEIDFQLIGDLIRIPVKKD